MGAPPPLSHKPRDGHVGSPDPFLAAPLGPRGAGTTGPGGRFCLAGISACFQRQPRGPGAAGQVAGPGTRASRPSSQRFLTAPGPGRCCCWCCWCCCCRRGGAAREPAAGTREPPTRKRRVCTAGSRRSPARPPARPSGRQERKLRPGV